jgi:hypothetical protein
MEKIAEMVNALALFKEEESSLRVEVVLVLHKVLESMLSSALSIHILKMNLSQMLLPK